MKSKCLQEAIDSVVEKWKAIEPPPKFVTDERFSTPQYSLLDYVPLFSSFKCFEESAFGYSFHGYPITCAIKIERERLIHIALVNFRVVPVYQPFIIPSQHECKNLLRFLSLAFSELRFSTSSLREMPDGRIGSSLLLTLGYMQICSSLTHPTSFETGCDYVDAAQGCTLDFVTESPIIVNEAVVAKEIKAINEEYQRIASQIVSQK